MARLPSAIVHAHVLSALRSIQHGSCIDGALAQHVVRPAAAALPPISPGLLDEEGGKRRLVLDVDDALLERKTRSIPRADVAALVVGCLGLASATNRAFDVCCDPVGEGEPSSNWEELLSTLGGRNCDYSINSQAEAAAPAAAAASAP